MDPLKHYLPDLESEMRRLVTSHTHGPDLMYGMMRYHLGWVDRDFQPVDLPAGKRIRPIILLLASEAQGGNWQQALPAAAAIELLHNFTLIHDDIEDGDQLRRGRPTLWSIWGVPQAINAGDAMFTISYRGLLRLPDHGVSADRTVAAAQCYAEAVLHITEGQCRDIGFETDDQISEAQYLAMISGKTAALLGLAAEVGAVIAGAGDEHRAALRDFGESLGKAFQMYDDLLGLWGDPEKTGKPVGSDLVKRKKTLPILHGIQSSTTFRDLLAGEVLTRPGIRTALAELESCGSRAYTEAQARHFHDRALTALQRSGGIGPAQEALHALAQRLLGRQA